MDDERPSDDGLANEQLANEQPDDEQAADEQSGDEKPVAQPAADKHRAAEKPTASHHGTAAHRERYEIASDHDLLLVVKDYWTYTSPFTRRPVEQRGELRAIYEFEVSRRVLTTIPYFRHLLTPDIREGEQQVIELKHDDPKAWKTLLQILHGRLEHSSYDIPTDAVWHILLIAEKYGTSPTSQNARDWFNEWLITQSTEGLFTDQRRICKILFPCYAFDHALGFSAGTMWLAYNSVGQIKEMRPAHFDEHMHL